MKHCGRISSSDFPPLVDCTSIDAVFDSEVLVCEILSRVPVKSLMSCKCVCKLWQSIICKNPYFIDLHFSRSKSRTSLDERCLGGDVFLLIEWVNYDWGGGPRLLSAEIQLSEGGGRATVQREIPVIPSPEGEALIVDIINGLFCLVDTISRCVCIYNPSTRESTPWIKSTFKQQWEDEFQETQVTDEDGDHMMHEVTYRSWHAFGYDPATKQHKVVAFWKKKTNTCRGSSYDVACEVLTIAGRGTEPNNRRFREVSLPPQVDPRELELVKPLYASGCIYWMSDNLILINEPYILEFNVGREEFRIFSLPIFIINDILYPCRAQLIEVDGHLAVVGKKVDMECQEINNTSMKMCILHVSQDPDRKMQKTYVPTGMSKVACSTSTDSSYYWTEETFLMPPPFDWDPRYRDAILAIPETDLFIIRSFENGNFCFYYYNWRKKYFSAKSEIVGMTSFFQDTAQLVSSHCVLRTYRESLLRVVENEANNRRFRGVSLPPKVDPWDLQLVKPLYASGSIYWLYDDFMLHIKEPYVLEFNVGSEEFRIFSVPNFIVYDIRYPCFGQLIEVDGHLSVVGKKVDMECQMSNNTSMKMCILHVDHDRDRKMQKTNMATCMSKVTCSTSTDSCYYYWMEENFLMSPLFYWDPNYPDAILAIPGTDLFIIKSFRNGNFCFYYYNWRKK